MPRTVPLALTPAVRLRQEDGRNRKAVKTIKTFVLVLVALAVALPAAAQPDRLYDKDVKALLEQSRKTFEKFWDRLDNQLKNTTFRGPSGEWVVKKVGEDYKNTIDTAEKRISDSYSASTEVGNIFTEATRINSYVEQQGPTMKSASEWQAHVKVLGQLAHEYGGTFPPAQGQAYRRYTDKEVVAATKSIEDASKQFASTLDNTLKKDKSVPDATRKAMVTDAKGVGERAKALGSAVKDGKPASAQAAALMQQAKKVQDAFMAGSAATALNPAWGGVRGPMSTVASAFHQQF
jgi:hypothetical protein